MEQIVSLLIPALLGVLLIRLLLLPMGFLFRIAIHSCSGFLCLWLLNTVSGFTGILFPINAATILIGGFGGLPGISLLAVLEMLS